MTLDRRDFLKLAGAAGLAVTTLPGLPGSARAQSDPSGPYWVFVHAGGGWDPTLLCDPKGRADEEAEDPLNMYFTDQIGTAGNLRYAPVGMNQQFFDKHHQRTLVINGVDTQTNNHDAGVRHTFSGKLAQGHPALAALIAGESRDQPMAFISNGGYDVTGGLVAPTRVGNIGAVSRIAWPNSINGAPDGPPFHREPTLDRIRQAMNRRKGVVETQSDLPRHRHGISQLFTARTGQNTLRRLTEVLPGEFDRARLKRQSQVACAAFAAGISRSANLTLGGFDTHGNHDDSHIPRMTELLAGVDFLWDEAERQGIADDLIVMMGSDFGRTPGYNNGNGKDHWAITSVLLMGRGVPGNRVIGETNARHVPIPLDSATGRPAADPDKGMRIQPGHIHRALRRLAGLPEDVDRMFPIEARAEFDLLAS